MRRKSISVIGAIVCCFAVSTDAQILDNLKKQLPEPDKYNEADIIDEEYGIIMYEPLNMYVTDHGDSVRMCDGYACEGWVEDYYFNGQLLHKGYYIEGKLKVYKNYYDNGQLERDFRSIDDYRSTMKQFYKDGTMKSEVTYIDGSPLSWTDYYPSGKVQFEEEYHKSFEYFIKRNTYFEDGSPETVFELEHKKKLLFIQKEYFKNGQVKEEGEIVFDQTYFDYKQNGKWSYYDESGKLIKEVTFDFGEKMKEKEF